MQKSLIKKSVQPDQTTWPISQRKKQETLETFWNTYTTNHSTRLSNFRFKKPWASTPNGPKGYLNNQSRRCIPHIPWGTGTPLSFSNLLVGENSIVVEWVRTEQAYNMDDWKKVCKRWIFKCCEFYTRMIFTYTYPCDCVSQDLGGNRESFMCDNG